MKRKVIIVGGGIAGLTAAHELNIRGFAVEVYEKNTIPGGKARSMEVAGTGVVGRRNLPGEHGFRLFPGFYQHVIDTMKRIPFPGNKRGVYDNLVPAPHNCMVSPHGRQVICLTRFPRSLEDMKIMFSEGSMPRRLGLTRADMEFFAGRMWQLLTSCEERRIAEYEKTSWWDFIDAAKRSRHYQQHIAIGLTKVLVASDPKNANTRTIGDIGLQIIFNLLTPGGINDRVLNGPTNDVWINPWISYLQKRGVKYHLNSSLSGVIVSDNKISGVTIRKSPKKRGENVTADYYILALPVEAVAKYVDKNLVKLDPALGNLHSLAKMVNWMNGIQFYLKKPLKLVCGHEEYLATPWALTSLTEAQFWPKFPMSSYGDGKVKDILSVDISDWNTPGWKHKKPAKECTKEEIAQEVWYQIKRSLNNSRRQLINDRDLHSWFLDPDIQNRKDNPHKEVNLEPLLVNLKNSWHLRPEAKTKIPNLFLASDYIKTNTDLATMEGANEAARRAVNAILDESRSSASRCKIWKLHEPAMFALWRWHDRRRFVRGLPWSPSVPKIPTTLHNLHVATSKFLKF